MRKMFGVFLSLLFILAVAIPALSQVLPAPEVREQISQRLARDGFYLGQPGSADGLRFIEFAPAS